MSHPLGASWLKNRRGLFHLKRLDEEVKSFFKTEPYATTAVYNPDTGVYRLILDRVTPAPSEWSLFVGDCLQNLRSSLDYLVWQLTVANGNAPPPFPLPKKSQWKRLQFPIYLDQKEFSDHAVPQHLWGVSDKARRFIERVQPFGNPDHPLWLLGELSNIDKHRTLALTSAYLHNVTIVPPNGVRIIASELARPGFLHGKTEVARVTLFPRPPADEVNMKKSSVTIMIVFAGGMAAEGKPAVTVLGKIGQEAEKILKGARPFIRPRT